MYDPGADSVSSKNEYQNILLGGKARPARKLTTSPPSVSRLFVRCGVLSIAQPHRTPRPVTGILLLLLVRLLYYTVSVETKQDE
jgi:hypothetical protein